MIYKEGPYEGEVLQDDDSVKKIEVNEWTGFHIVGQMKGDMATAMAARPADGLWIAGKKYAITQSKEEELGDKKVNITLAASRESKTAVVICATESQIIVAMTDESKGQKPGNSIKAVTAFAEYLLGQGY